jgi:hypothetical protein
VKVGEPQALTVEAIEIRCHDVLVPVARHGLRSPGRRS